jgi:hypothetical protein
MATWQLKGLLLIASALVATMLVATSSGATSKEPAPAAAVQPPCAAAVAPFRSKGAIVVTRPSAGGTMPDIEPA